MTHDRRYWLRMLGWSIVSAVTAVVIFSGATWSTPWRLLVKPFTTSFLFTISIMPIAAYAMPRVMPRIRRRFQWPFNWAMVALVMVSIGLGGSAIAIGVLRLIGTIAPGQMWMWFAGSLRTTIIMTLIFGLTVSALEAMRARLDNATMALRTKERDEAEARRLAAEAKLASLESRVNPHFLFNTLNSIATLVHDDPQAAERMTTQLAALLRSSLESSSALVPLTDEIALVRAYLDIERVRFGDRLRYNIHIDNNAQAVRVPRLAVQTIVENAVKYAVSPSRAGASISIRARMDDGRTWIEVADDGPGFLAASVPDGHGLALVRERLAMTFGDRATLRIESAPGRTAAAIVIPSPAHGEPVEP
jgi:signal transduction histidine kinase